MNLKLIWPIDDDLDPDYQEEVTVRTEADIRTAGFAAARAVRSWLRRMPFVPSAGNLSFHVYAEVVSDGEAKLEPEKPATAPRPKRKRKASK